MLELNYADIAPEIRGANYFEENDVHLGPRYNFAYQLLYVFKGNGEAVINDRREQISPGFFTIYGPGDRHEFVNTSQQPMALGTINFSWRKESPARLAMGNSTVTELSPQYRDLSDPLCRIAGLSPFPLIMSIPLEERSQLERWLRETGYNYRNSNNPALILQYKSALLLIIELIIRIQRNAGEDREHPALVRFHRFIKSRYAGEIDRVDAARACGVSPSHLTALLRSRLQTNFTDYLNTVRMEVVLELLQFSRLSVKEIAERTGFRNYSYFVAHFRKIHGHPPGAWRTR